MNPKEIEKLKNERRTYIRGTLAVLVVYFIVSTAFSIIVVSPPQAINSAHLADYVNGLMQYLNSANASLERHSTALNLLTLTFALGFFTLNYQFCRIIGRPYMAMGTGASTWVRFAWLLVLTMGSLFPFNLLLLILLSRMGTQEINSRMRLAEAAPPPPTA
jgi:hypothetical protein